MTNFENLGLAEPILRAIKATGYLTPTPIQRDVIPVMMAQKDVIGIAQTGTGKTAAFVLPILDRIARNRKEPKPRTCDTLILAPTRELALQIANDIKTYGKFMKVSSTVIVGGLKPGPQIRVCAQGVNIIVATPGRLLDLMQSGAIRLDQTFLIILDEADQMMDMGFLPAIRRVMQALPKQKKTALLSATMPAQIRKLARDFMCNPAEVSVAPGSRPIDLIEQIVKRVEKSEKKTALIQVMADRNITRAIVFARTKHGANKLAVHLQKAGENALAIHGNKSQAQRERALASFKAGKTRILVATDIAARGIDIDNVSHVINFDLPNVPESYVHRIGRTARAGRSGVAISFCDTDEVKLLRDIEKLTGQILLPNNCKTNGGFKPKAPIAQRKKITQKKQERPIDKSKGDHNFKNSSSKHRRGPKEMYKPGPGSPTDGLNRILGERNSVAA